MITFRTLSTPSKSTFVRSTLAPAIYSPQGLIYDAARYADIRISSQEVTVTSESQFHIGSKPARIGKPHGTMRDHGVFHLGGSGTVTLTEGTAVVGFADAGIEALLPSFSTSAGLRSAWVDVDWGTPVEYTQSIPAYVQIYKGYSYYIGPSSWSVDAHWDGNYGVIAVDVINPTRIKAGTTNNTGLPRRYAFIVLQRDGDTIHHRLYPTYWTDGIITDAARADAMTYCKSLAYSTMLNNTVTLNVETFGSASGVIDDILSSASYQLSRLDVVTDYSPDFGELALQCYDQVRLVDQSVFNLVFDVLNWKSYLDLGKSLLSLGNFSDISKRYQKILRSKGPKKAKAFLREAKSSSNMFLGTKYGVSPNISDVRRLIDGILEFCSGNFINKRIHSRKEVLVSNDLGQAISITSVLTVVVAAFPTWFTGRIAEDIADLKSMGIYPEIYDLWDVIPYSFVLDWFIPIGDLLQDISNYSNIRDYFPIEYCVISDKRELSIDARESVPTDSIAYRLVNGSITLTWYYRWISRELPLPTVSLEAESTVGNHLPEATALVVQRL